MGKRFGPRVRRALYRAVLMRLGTTLQDLEILQKLEHLPRHKIDAFQQDRLRRLLRHAARRVPYYREVLTEAGVVSASGNVRLDRFSQIPLLEKSTLHERFEDLKSEDVSGRDWYQNTSGGSTGETARFIQDREFADWGRAVGLLFDSWAGYSPGDLKFLIWPVHRDLAGRRTSIRSIGGTLLRNETWLDARRMTHDQMRESLKWIDRKQPVQVYAFPENLYELARIALQEELQPRPPGAIVTSGGILLPAVRETISIAFHAPIFDRYGSRELSGIAAECIAHSGLHICPALQYVEILKPDGFRADPGENGELVVTSLVNYAMPLIRYRVGDVAAWSTDACSCEREWPMLRGLEGRNRDLFVKRDGTRIRILERVFHQHVWVRQFQVIQEEYDHVRVLLVPNGYAQDTLTRVTSEVEQIQESIRNSMGQDCRVEVILTGHIDTAPSGKFRQQISKVG